MLQNHQCRQNVMEGGLGAGILSVGIAAGGQGGAPIVR